MKSSKLKSLSLTYAHLLTPCVRIITLLTPLMRRVVQNERQRVYAAEKKEKERAASIATNDETPRSIQAFAPLPDDDEFSIINDTIFDTCDFSLASSASTVDGFSPPQLHFEPIPSRMPQLDDCEIRYNVNIMKDGHRLQPKFVLTSAICADFPSLIQHINNCVHVTQRIASVKALGPGGLLELRDEVTWQAAIASVRQSEWMDGDLTCVVEVEKAI